MVDHIGFDAAATNAAHATGWANPPLRAAPVVPMMWPEPRERLECRTLWRQATTAGRFGLPGRIIRGCLRTLKRKLRAT
jgi:hypothetical protein